MSTDTVPATPNFSPQKYVASASRGLAACRRLLLGCRHCAFLFLSPRTLHLILSHFAACFPSL
jgi:hypothetical protein